mgnify:CR=1 FL=1
MRKLLLTIIILSFGLILSACGSGQDKKELVVGATNEPHAVILEEAKPLLEKEGIELEIVTFSSYGMINPALADESLDANYFQHIPYLEAQIEEFGYDFVNAGGIHIEPMGIYSQKYSSLDELPDNATIIISNSVPDHGRILSLFESHGLIKLKDGIDKTTATLDDIVENPKNLQFEYNYASPSKVLTLLTSTSSQYVPEMRIVKKSRNWWKYFAQKKFNNSSSKNGAERWFR